ncbi:hypothetical protein CYLTODRAFT_495464 [Cylindrobasidium torrendii FP15055 ss-10]|uniref:Uncharacterized protein n=1 Tax=Cylindrobasidium torrendii FP15055 ss-10 TaxID=1314674 RepID=A0A0D7AUH3_9AGAR|nr:hypothetical protein CYLTODRAFT_495464 [Cylindrobasidium torrendii FP15055 ss-10]
MVFTKKKGRPRKYPTAAAAKAASQDKRARYEESHREFREARRKRDLPRSPVIRWTAPSKTLWELQDDDAAEVTFPVPQDSQLALLYCKVKRLHSEILNALDGSAENWFTAAFFALQNTRGKELQDNIECLEHALRSLNPYFRAMDIAYDTYAVFFKDNGN